MITRISEKVFQDLFKSISSGKNRVSLKTALNGLNSFFNSNENPYKKQICDDSTDYRISSQEFMDQFYSRQIDKRHGLRSQILMVGGPKNIRGNSGGPMDAMLSFPQITFEQFFGIAKDMECIFLEKLLPGSCQTKLTRTYDTKEFKKIQKIANKQLINEVKTIV